MCDNCPKKPTCKEICPDLEVLLLGLNKYSLNSTYIIKFMDPMIIEILFHEYELYSVQKSKRSTDLCLTLKSVISQLNDHERQATILYYGLDGSSDYVGSQPKIAKEMAVSQNTIKYYLQQARQKLFNLIISQLPSKERKATIKYKREEDKRKEAKR